MQKRGPAEGRPLAEDQAASTQQSWTQTSASDPQPVSHEPKAVSWETPGLERPHSCLGEIVPQQTGARLQGAPGMEGMLLVMKHPGAGAGFTDNPCGEHSTSQTGITPLIPVKISLLYFPPPFLNRKLVYFHVRNFARRRKRLF